MNTLEQRTDKKIEEINKQITKWSKERDWCWERFHVLASRVDKLNKKLLHAQKRKP